MSHVTRRRAATLALALSTLPVFLLPVAAVADTAPPSAKAAIEHAERQADATPTHPTKAQIEHREATTPSRPAGQQATPSSSVRSGGPDATTWQLALSAALGALVTGGVVLGSRRFSHHGTAIAS
jgi:hypothetical protein